MVRKIIKFIKREVKYLLWWISAYFPLIPSQMLHHIRPWIWRRIGVEIGKNVMIGFGTYLDVDNAKLVTIEDNVIITSHTLLLCHRRDISTYTKGVLQKDLPYMKKGIYIEENASIGMRSIIMPGVKIGKGAVIGSNSVVIKNVEPYTIVAGNPAKVIKVIK